MTCSMCQGGGRIYEHVQDDTGIPCPACTRPQGKKQLTLAEVERQTINFYVPGFDEMSPETQAAIVQIWRMDTRRPEGPCKHSRATPKPLRAEED